MTRVIRCSNEEYDLLCYSAKSMLEQLDKLLTGYIGDTELPSAYVTCAGDKLLSTIKQKKSMFDNMGIESWNDDTIKSIEDVWNSYKIMIQ